MCVTLSLATVIILDRQGVVAQMVQKLSAGRTANSNLTLQVWSFLPLTAFGSCFSLPPNSSWDFTIVTKQLMGGRL